MTDHWQQSGYAISTRLLKATTVAVLGLGAVLRIVQYAADRSQWLDEILLSQNVVDRNVHDLLLRPLEYTLAPPLFLLLEKCSSVLAGPTDRALRFAAFAFGLAAIPAFYSVSIRVLRPLAAPFAAVLFATAVPLIVSSGQAKQYSTDVFVALIVLLIGIELTSRSLDGRVAVTFAVIGVFAPWLSQPSVFVIAGVCSALLFFWYRQPRRGTRSTSARWAVLIASVWVLSAIAAAAFAWFSLRSSQRGYLDSFWAAGFAPSPLLQFRTLVWPIRALDSLFGRGGPFSLLYHYPIVYTTTACLGLALLVRRSHLHGSMVVAPISFTLIASVFHAYPFADRLILFLVPLLFLGFAEALAAAIEFVTLTAGNIGLIPLVALAAVVIPVASALPPYRTEDLKPVLQYVAAHRAPQDIIYIYSGASVGLRFYGQQYGLLPSQYRVGDSHRCHPRSYLKELDALRNNPRVWIILTHGGPYHERDEIVRYLGAVGTVLDQSVVAGYAPAGADASLTTGAEAYLYDLTLTSRSRLVNADTFPLAPVLSNSMFPCDDN